MFDFQRQDPEFAERFEHFAFDEVVNEPGQQLDDVTRHLAILATLLGCQGIDAFREELPAALDGGVTPVMARAARASTPSGRSCPPLWTGASPR